MFYGFSALLFVLSLVTGIPAIPRLLQMRKIKQNSATTTGLVQLDAGIGWLMTSFLGTMSNLKVLYRTPDEKEYVIEVIDSSAFKIRRYKPGDSVEVLYDKNSPWLAYLRKEWDNMLRDLWVSAAELLVAVVLWRTGLALKLPI